ncbi:hypothetical protein FSARC_15015 [Fusarium sarcochroum]|uniref:DNA2/NAM7 helicase-like C-terminal domain-containing protein n=1 Tax=Fusarium sarcochroum TaxID=1208366 RepID=A0A8H4SPH0_9HYPO|nr:hypothetical protein FSARC_15015 [Fusarium sarcochroum]
MSELSIDTHDAHDNSRDARRPNIGMSGSTYCLKYMYAHPEQFEELIEFFRRLHNGKKLDDGERSAHRWRARDLVFDAFANFDGIVITTYTAASSHQFKTAFRPDVVFMDEAEHTIHDAEHDLTTPSHQTSLPLGIGNQHSLALLKVAMSIQHACLWRCNVSGQLPILQRYYNDIMHSNEEWPQALLDQFDWIRENVDSRHPNTCSVLVEVPGSRTQQIGTSQGNASHRTGALEKIHALLRSKLTGLGINKGKPITIMLISMYKGQVTEYHKDARRLVDEKKLHADFFNRVKIKTARTDIVFIDFVNANYTGRIGDDHLLAVVLTRSRRSNVTMLNRGTFSGLEWREDQLYHYEKK